MRKLQLIRGFVFSPLLLEAESSFVHFAARLTAMLAFDISVYTLLINTTAK